MLPVVSLNKETTSPSEKVEFGISIEPPVSIRTYLPTSPTARIYAVVLVPTAGTSLKPTELVPSTVQPESVPEVGVPRTGVTKVGEVAKTN